MRKRRPPITAQVLFDKFTAEIDLVDRLLNKLAEYHDSPPCPEQRRGVAVDVVWRQSRRFFKTIHVDSVLGVVRRFGVDDSDLMVTGGCTDDNDTCRCDGCVNDRLADFFCAMLTDAVSFVEFVDSQDCRGEFALNTTRIAILFKDIDLFEEAGAFAGEPTKTQMSDLAAVKTRLQAKLHRLEHPRGLVKELVSKAVDAVLASARACKQKEKKQKKKARRAAAVCIQSHVRRMLVVARCKVAPHEPRDRGGEPPTSDDESDMCVICIDEKRSHLCVPCGHRCLCTSCAQKHTPTSCPVCRQDVAMVVRVYL